MDQFIGGVMASVGLYYLVPYGYRRLSRWVAKRNLARDEDEWVLDNLAAADVRDRIRHNVRNQG